MGDMKKICLLRLNFSIQSSILFQCSPHLLVPGLGSTSPFKIWDCVSTKSNKFISSSFNLRRFRVISFSTVMSSQENAKFQDPLFVSKQVNDYTLSLGFREDPIARELRIETAKHSRAIMMGDPVEASLFKILLPAIGAKNVIEVGVFTGYTTLIMAQALGPQGKVVALDICEEFINIGKPFWKKANISDRIHLKIAPATDTLKQMVEQGMKDTFDFAFIDADKINYPVYYELLLSLVRPNGIIAIDNVLWFGRVLDDSITDPDTMAIRQISRLVHHDDRVEHVLLPFADGVTLVRRK